jgi:hypothetical protein
MADFGLNITSLFDLLLEKFFHTRKTNVMLFLCIWFSWRSPQWKHPNHLDAYSSQTNPKNFLRPVQIRSDIANLKIYRAKSGSIFVEVDLMISMGK